MSGAGVNTVIQALNRAEGIDVKGVDIDGNAINIATTESVEDLRDTLLSELEGIDSRIYDSGADESLISIAATEDTLSDVKSVLDSIDADTNDISSIDTNTGNIDSNTDSIDTNTGNIDSNTSSIDTNTGSIDTNTSNIDSNTDSIDTNTSSIDSNTSSIDTNTSNIDTNTSNIDSNTSDIYDDVAKEEDFNGVSNTNSATDGSVTVDLDTGGRPHVQLYYEGLDAGTVEFQTSNDDSTWRTFDTIDASESGVESSDDIQYPWTARRYVRAVLTGASGDVELDIAATR